MQCYEQYQMQGILPSGGSVGGVCTSWGAGAGLALLLLLLLLLLPPPPCRPLDRPCLACPPCAALSCPLPPTDPAAAAAAAAAAASPTFCAGQSTATPPPGCCPRPRPLRLGRAARLPPTLRWCEARGRPSPQPRSTPLAAPTPRVEGLARGVLALAHPGDASRHRWRQPTLATPPRLAQGPWWLGGITGQPRRLRRSGPGASSTALNNHSLPAGTGITGVHAFVLLLRGAWEQRPGWSAAAPCCTTTTSMSQHRTLRPPFCACQRAAVMCNFDAVRA